MVEAYENQYLKDRKIVIKSDFPTEITNYGNWVITFIIHFLLDFAWIENLMFHAIVEQYLNGEIMERKISSYIVFGVSCGQ